MTLAELDTSGHVTLIRRAVMKAALKLLSLMEKPKGLLHSRKSDRSWVSALDVESDAVIRYELRDSDVPIISEEVVRSHEQIGLDGTFYLVDPLDGTSVCRLYMGDMNGQVGYGPLVGLVHDSIVQAVVFANITQGLLFVAERERDLIVTPIFDPSAVLVLSNLRTQRRSLAECVMLFHVGSALEAHLAYELREKGLIDNAYRFGGFANDACRLALGYEDIQLQLSLSPWDLCATLIPQSAGLSVWVDPLGVPTSLLQWKIKVNNPVLVCPPQLADDLLCHLNNHKSYCRD
jgi:fructose-1,6-bisphosphatase/inositol monophosphatase family enzyme